jgi:hypothetical protein
MVDNSEISDGSKPSLTPWLDTAFFYDRTFLSNCKQCPDSTMSR